MKKTFFGFTFLMSACLVTGAETVQITPPVQGAEKAVFVKAGATALPETLVREGVTSIGRGVDYLLSKQAADGSFGGDPAITGLCVMAINQSGSAVEKAKRDASVSRGREYILKHVQKDGSICAGGRMRAYPTYSTAIALTSLATLRNPADRDVMLAARAFLISLQLDEDNADRPTKADDPKYGGIGYGPGKRGASHVDLSNTQWVAEALYASEYLVKEDPRLQKEADLAWGKLAKFMTNMQHFPETNKQKWVVPDKSDSNYGGFVYVSEKGDEAPDRAGRKDASKGDGAAKERPSLDPGAGTDMGKASSDSSVNVRSGQGETLRSYGSMTYAGLKSMIYAKVSKDDPRVSAALSWAAKNYTLDENPGMGSAGHYYYIQTFAKAHGALGDALVKTPDGTEHNWRIDLVKKLLSLQRGDGEWYNANNRYMEAMPVLTTAYSLMSMEFALSGYLVD